MAEFIIEKGVHLPKVRSSKHERLRETFLDMEVDDSVFFADGGGYQQPMLCSVVNGVRIADSARRYTVRKFQQPDGTKGYRVWRLA